LPAILSQRPCGGYPAAGQISAVSLSPLPCPALGAKIRLVPCNKYNALKERLFAAMMAEDRAHYQSHASIKAHDKALQDTRAAVKLVEFESTWHVQGCEQCKAEGNEALTAAPM